MAKISKIIKEKGPKRNNRKGPALPRRGLIVQGGLLSSAFSDFAMDESTEAHNGQAGNRAKRTPFDAEKARSTRDERETGRQHRDSAQYENGARRGQFVPEKSLRSRHVRHGIASFPRFAILSKHRAWIQNYHSIAAVLRQVYKKTTSFGVFRFLTPMIKKFSSPKIKMWFEPMFLTGSSSGEFIEPLRF